MTPARRINRQRRYPRKKIERGLWKSFWGPCNIGGVSYSDNCPDCGHSTGSHGPSCWCSACSTDETAAVIAKRNAEGRFA